MYRTKLMVPRTAWLVVVLLLFAASMTLAQQAKTERTGKATAAPAATPEATTSSRSEDRVFMGMKYRVIGPFRGGRSLTASGIPGDPTTYYFGATGGGVWKSTDGAMTWTSVFDKEAVSSIGSLAVAPSDSNTLRLRQRAPAASWFPGAEAASGPRLFCFPYAGGGAAAFAPWRAEARGPFSVCPVLFPGRESRAAEAPFTRIAPLVEALAAAIDPYLDRPFAFFGHSMGAAVAFELARALRRRGRPLPAMLVVSAARAPQFRRNYTPPPDPSEPQFLEELRRLGGIPSEALDDPAVLRAILPALSADAAVYRRYVYAEDAPLPCPIRAYGGAADPNIRPEHLAAWAGQTSASFAVRAFPGGHFFLHSARPELLAALAADLEGAC